jgi:hypothetical protein
MNTPTSSGTSVPLWQHKDDDALEESAELCPCPADMHERVQIQWQFFIRAINPGISLQHVAALFGPTKAFTNRGRKDLRANHLMGTKLNRPAPEFDKVRTCALSVLTGIVSGEHLIVTMLDGSQEPRSGRTQVSKGGDINLDDIFSPQTTGFSSPISSGGMGEPYRFRMGHVYWMNDDRTYTWLPHVKRRSSVRYPYRIDPASTGAPPPSPYNFEQVKKARKKKSIQS